MKDKFEIVFKRLKDAKLDENILCSDFWRKIIKLHENFNEAECWELTTQNIAWLFKAKSFFGISSEILKPSELKEWFTEAELNAHNIYTKGNHYLTNVQVIGMGNVRLEVYGHSEVILFETAHANCGDTTFVKGYDNTTFTATDCIGNAFENCKAKAVGVSIVENWSNNAVEKVGDCLVVDRE